MDGTGPASLSLVFVVAIADSKIDGSSQESEGSNTEHFFHKSCELISLLAESPALRMINETVHRSNKQVGGEPS